MKSIEITAITVAILIFTGCSTKLPTTICKAKGKPNIELRSIVGKKSFSFNHNAPHLFYKTDDISVMYTGTHFYYKDKFEINIRWGDRPIFYKSSAYPNRLIIDNEKGILIAKDTLIKNDSSVYNCDENLTKVYNAILPAKPIFTDIGGEKLRCVKTKDHALLRQYYGNLINDKVMINNKDYTSKYKLTSINIDDIMIEGRTGSFCNIIKRK